ncbi:MAG: hypothetical protein I8H71_02145 [Xanthomonadaceae bacterium]|nr:hypothetical protein [Xanthomonadaceae bacterium]
MSRRVLRVHLTASAGLASLSAVLPVNVVDARGLPLGTVAASLYGVTELRYKSADGPLFARLSLPSGATETQMVQEPGGQYRREVTFYVGDGPSPDPRMAWSAPRLDAQRRGGALLNVTGMKDAWFQLWEKPNWAVRWRQIPLGEQLVGMPLSREAMQLDFGYSGRPRALVVRLNHDVPQVVALPRTSLNVLVTSQRTLSGTVTPRVVVGGYSPNAEAIMDFMRIGKLNPVEAMLEPDGDLAFRLLKDKVEDPIAATAAAYFLLRRRDWERLPLAWLDNLTRWNPEIPDARLIYAMTRIGRGVPMPEAVELATTTLSEISDAGIPLFAEAATLLGDLLALSERSEEPLNLDLAKTLRTMIASARPAGLSFGFAGKAPDQPMAPWQAFEQRKVERFSPTLADVARNVDISESPLEWLTQLDISPPSRGLELEIASGRIAVPGPFVRSLVTGSVANTLFLRDVMDEGVGGFVPSADLRLPDSS